jgi:hypothetical protein
MEGEMPRAKTSAEDLLLKVLGLFKFDSAYKSALNVGDRFVDADGTLKTVSAKGKKNGLIVLSYEDCADIDIFEAATENEAVLLVSPKTVETETKAEPDATDALLASLGTDPEPTAPAATAQKKKGVSVRPE